MVDATDTEKAVNVPRKLRIPLQTGTSAARDQVFGSVSLLVLLAIGTPMVWNAGHNLPILVLLVGFFGGLTALLIGLIALQRRATDLELGDDALVVRGGRHDGVTIKYSDIDPSTVAVVQRESDKDSTSNFPSARLEVCRRDGRAVELAYIMDYGEERFFLEETRAIIVALTSMNPAVPPALATSAEVLACDSCGNLVAPAPTLTVSCHCCHGSVYIPEAVRSRIASHQAITESERTAQALVNKLLCQPRAVTINRLLYAFLVLSVATTYVSLWAMGRHSFSLAVTAYCLLHVLYQLIRRTVAHRVGFRSLLFFGKAMRAVGDEQLAACRNCGALLPMNDAPGPVVRCAYCNEPSLLGIALPWRFDRITTARVNLGKVLSTVTAARSRCNQRLVLLGLVLAVSLPVLIAAPPW